MGSLMEMFPEACPNYLRNLCSNIEFSEKNLNELITKILSGMNKARDDMGSSEKLQL